jgi:hypothetical protein
MYVLKNICGGQVCVENLIKNPKKLKKRRALLAFFKKICYNTMVK